MKRVLPALLGLLLLSGAAVNAEQEGKCVCSVAQETMAWCELHDVGHFASIPIRSKFLFDALDAHGHDLDLESFTCDDCRKAAASDGFCTQHRIGFVEKKAYFSSLSYHLARGETTPVSEIACPICRKNAETHGWCEADKVGRVGNVAIDTKEDYEQVAEAIQIVQAADEAAERCKYCATAIISDTRCPFCRITYKDGEPVPPKKN